MADGKIVDVKTNLPGPKSAALIERWGKAEARTTGFQAPIAVDYGRGALIYDVDGNRFIDWTSGVLVTGIGHCHPRMVELVAESTNKMLNCYEYPTEYRVRAAEGVVASAPEHLDTCFFLSTGGEATDAMLRIMKRKSGAHEIISFYGGFHGRLYSPASAGGLAKIKKKFGPTMPGVIRSPYPYCYRCPFKQKKETCGFLCLEFLDDVVRANSCGDIAGLITEPYLGTSGFIFPPEGWMNQLEKWVREMGILFALDEVQSSFGRGGKMWFMEWEGLKPDIACAGKGIGSGIAQSAIVATSDIMSCLGRGELSSTAGGNPTACAATLAVLEVIEKENLLERAVHVGDVMLRRLQDVIPKAAHVGDVRGKGLVLGIEVVEDKQSKVPAPELCKKIVLECAKRGLLVGIVGIYGNVIRVGPPLVITDDEIAESLDIMEEVLMSL